MKYAFESKEIKTCSDCPICVTAGYPKVMSAYCPFLSFRMEREQYETEKMKWCPLTEEKGDA